MPVLDTNILVSLLKDDHDAKEKLRLLEEIGENIYTSSVTAYELLKGAAISGKPEQNLSKVRDLLSTTELILMSQRISEEAATIYKELREKGKLIGEFDILIAACARSNDEKLITRDEDFKNVKGLSVEKW